MSNEQPYLVTGGNGYTGRFVVELLLRSGYRVRATVRRPEYAPALKALGVEVQIADLTDAASLRRAVTGVRGVFNLAAAYRDPKTTSEQFRAVNVDGLRKLLDASIEAGVRRFVHCSTIGVTSHIEGPPANETHPYCPSDDYQESKRDGELLALDYFQNSKIRGVVIRPAMIFGPHDTRFLKLFRMIAKQRFFYVGAGRGAVHFIDVRDLARAFLLAMEHEERNAEVYIIAGAKSLPLREFCAIVATELGVSSPWLSIPVMPMQVAGSLCEALCAPFGVAPPLYRRRVDFFIKNRHFDISKARNHLGYSPSQDLKSEIRDVIASYRAQGWL